jgi:glutathione S-transferase
MTITLYQHPLSGHSHRVRLMLSLLDLDTNIVDVDLARGAHKEPDFLTKNPLGQFPVLEDGEITLADSNAILVYLASKHDQTGTWYPNDPIVRAKVQKYLSIAAGQIASGPAAARLVNVFGASLDHARAKDIASAVLAILDKHLAENTWLACDHATIADVANYAYIAHAPEGDINLTPYANILRWLNRIENLPGFTPMTATPVGLAA